MKRLIVLALMLMYFGCGLHAQTTNHWYKVELYFGRKDHGKVINEKKWQRFVDEYITPRFPNGLTVVEGAGQWRGKDSVIIREPAKIVVLVCKKDSATLAHIEYIKSRYKELYHQESVMEVDLEAQGVSF